MAASNMSQLLHMATSGGAPSPRLWEVSGSSPRLQLPGAHGHAEPAGWSYGRPACAPRRLSTDYLQEVGTQRLHTTVKHPCLVWKVWFACSLRFKVLEACPPEL